MTIEVTDAMIAVFEEAYDFPGIIAGDTRAGLAAVLKLLDPVPDGVMVVTDNAGVSWRRNGVDPLVWVDDAGHQRVRTAYWINERYGPLRWSGHARTDSPSPS